MKCPKCGADVVQSDRFCTNCGFSLVGRGEPVTSSPEQAPQQVAQQALQESAQPIVQQAEHPFTQHPSVQQAAEKAVSPHHRGLIVALSILGVIVVAVSLIISLMAFHVVANPLQKPRLVALKISAPRYQEGSDSKIPLHITGRTVSGRVISQHVYVSPKAASVRLEPGQYTVTVEASPLLSSGDVYRIPQPLKIDTASGSNFVGESKPMKQDLKFEVKPASEVTASDLQAMAKFAKKTATPVKKLDFLTEKIRRQKVSTAFSQVLDMLSTKGIKSGSSDDKSSRYSLFDLDEDGVPELFTWYGINGDKKRASDGPVGCGDKQDDFSGNRVWKYDAKKNIAFCFSKQSLPDPNDLFYKYLPDTHVFTYESDPAAKSAREGENFDWLGVNYVTLSVDREELKVSHQTYRDLFGEIGAEMPSIIGRDIASLINDQSILSLYAMTMPKSVSAQGVDNYEKFAQKVSDWTANGVQTLIGTVKLMTDKQIIDYQHQYVTQHHLNKELDPSVANDSYLERMRNPRSDESEEDNNWKEAVFIPEEARMEETREDSERLSIPLYLYGMNGYEHYHGAGSIPQEDAKYFGWENNRVIMSISGTQWSWGPGPLPWKQKMFWWTDSPIVLPNSTAQPQAAASEK